MKFRKLKISNFRNFDDCVINLTNKNLIFGMNDVGKSNMLYALQCYLIVGLEVPPY